ncbi:MAG: dihydroorotate dehydrogenase electron transfer subunit [Acidobacteria bacterium]|jgi:dihydroorotate dehydrogenase electron transfer subunit|nr:dihydroorotate dehydrogenase electron transfer subunit [Acidobacteriota bacterium]
MLADVDATVLENRRLSEHYSVLVLDAPPIAAVTQPGQFVMLKPAQGSDPLLRRPFSVFEILRGPAGEPAAISILNKRAGVGTALLYDVEPGTTIRCLGPLGKPFEAVRPPAEAWMVAGGVGLAPFVTLATRLEELGTPATLFYGARTASELYYVELFEALGVRTVLSTEDGTRGVRGRVTAPLRDTLSATPDTTDIRLYACGPTPMMRAVARLAADHRRPCDVSLEQVMGCGLGGCYSCVVLTTLPGGTPHFVRSCIEGPVFDARHLVWEALEG